jgi:glycine dehydrogenase subunit 1
MPTNQWNTQFNFLPHTPTERQTMLASMGLDSIEQLFSDIPSDLRENMQYHLLPQHGLSEAELTAELKQSSQDNVASNYSSFLGGGAYARFIPMAINMLASRSEFYTAYTPYQPEVSQGTLQVIYEFQTMIADLCGLDVANASVYDGGNAISEAAMMAVRATKRKVIYASSTIHPQYRAILQTYVTGLGDVTLQWFDSLAQLQVLAPQQQQSVACVVIQQPNYFGQVQVLDGFATFCEQAGALFIANCDPIALGLIEPPPADIIVGDIQQLGNHLSYGGPYGGFMATTNRLMRQLPGRLVGKTVDSQGNPCYTLTLQTREQHIRREKATSNICTNQALNVLRATIYLSLVGPQGLQHLAKLSGDRAHYLAEQLSQVEGLSLAFTDTPFISEFVLRLDASKGSVTELLKALETHHILGGIALGQYCPDLADALLISVTEMNTPQQLQAYITAMDAILKAPSLLAQNQAEAHLSNPHAKGMCLI